MLISRYCPPLDLRSMEEGGHGGDPGRGWEGVGGCVSNGLGTEASRPSVLLSHYASFLCCHSTPVCHKGQQLMPLRATCASLDKG